MRRDSKSLFVSHIQMRSRSNSGFTLSVVVVSVLILSVLGLALLAISTNESIFASRQYNRTQAYYSAKSGAEIAFEHLQDQWINGPYYTVEELFDDYGDTQYTGSISPDNSDVFSTAYDFDISNVANVKISSQSVKDDVISNTALDVSFHFPAVIEDSWLNPGEVTKNGSYSLAEELGAAVLNPRKILGHNPKKEAQNNTIWTATRVHFVSRLEDTEASLEVQKSSLLINTHLVTFTHKVSISDEDCTFMLDNYPSNEGFDDEITDKDFPEIDAGWGVVVFKDGLQIKDVLTVDGLHESWSLDPGYYAYAPEIELNKLYSISIDDDEDLTDYLVEINDQATKDYIDKIILEDTGYYVTSKIWSAN